VDRIAGTELVQLLQKRFPGITPVEDRFDSTVLVGEEQLMGLLTALKEAYGFNYLADLTAVDNKTYFMVIYRVHSLPDNRQIVVKVKVERNNPCLPTASALWGAADWQERELYDLMGINFSGRSITRILLPEEFVGHPLRKDYQGGRQA